MKLSDASWIAPLLTAVAAGETLQVKNCADQWVDLLEAASFATGDKDNYRIKPKQPEYRVFINLGSPHPAVCTRNSERSYVGHVEAVEKYIKEGRARWLGPWMPLEQI